MKRCSVLFIIRELQTERACSITTHLLEMSKIQNTGTTKWLQGCEATETLIHCWWECKMIQLLSIFWQSLAMLNISLPFIQQLHSMSWIFMSTQKQKCLQGLYTWSSKIEHNQNFFQYVTRLKENLAHHTIK